MNYIIEGNIDFKKLLHEPDNFDESNNSNEVCLLTGERLTLNNMKLACGHRFNYKALYNELYATLDLAKYAHFMPRCPYCRCKFTYLLPYIPFIPGVEKKKGINWPEKACIKTQPCERIIKRGPCKNKMCGRPGFKTSENSGYICSTHWKYDNRNKCLNNVGETQQNNIDRLWKKFTVVELKNILRKNKLKLTGNKKELLHRLINKNLIG